MTQSDITFTAKTFSGLEGVLSRELEDIGAQQINIGNRAVSFQGDIELMIRANLHCRTALNILREIHSFNFTDKDDFFAHMLEIRWSEYFDVDESISVYAVANRSELFTNTMFLGQFTKDAIADHFRALTGRRPDVDNKEPRVKINVYVYHDSCVVSLDSSGDPLFKRGYRKDGGSAPLNEVLAAGLIMLSGWDKESLFLDPMCGSGTFSVEAAMMASGMAPGLMRRHFGFMHWAGYDPTVFDNIREEARQKQRPLRAPILASDVNIKGLDMARQNVMNAGFMGNVKVQRNDFFTFFPPAGHGWVMLNPPYGHRLRQDDIPAFYKKIGDTLKQHYDGFHAGIISQEAGGLKHVGLKPKTRYRVFNGPIECRFVVYELFKGTHKEHVAAVRPKRPRMPMS
jgi:putative N6-adenine-specific DNA methylase